MKPEATKGSQKVLPGVVNFLNGEIIYSLFSEEKWRKIPCSISIAGF